MVPAVGELVAQNELVGSAPRNPAARARMTRKDMNQQPIQRRTLQQKCRTSTKKDV